MIVNEILYHNIETCLRNIVAEDDETRRQFIAKHILKVLQTGRI